VTDAMKGKSIAEIISMDKQDVLDLLIIPISQVRLKCACCRSTRRIASYRIQQKKRQTWAADREKQDSR